MILKQDLRWSLGGIRIEVTRVGEYNDGVLPARVQEIALRAGLVEREISAKSSRTAKEKKVTTSKKG